VKIWTKVKCHVFYGPQCRMLVVVAGRMPSPVSISSSFLAPRSSCYTLTASLRFVFILFSTRSDHGSHTFVENGAAATWWIQRTECTAAVISQW